MRFRNKLSVSLVFVGLLASQVMFWPLYLRTRANLESASFDKLTALREHKKERIEAYFESLDKQAGSLAQTPWLGQALTQFHSAFQGLAAPADQVRAAESQRLQDYAAYLKAIGVEPGRSTALLPKTAAALLLQNRFRTPEPAMAAGSRASSPAPDTTLALYATIHQQHHARFQAYIERFGFQDLLLVEPAGTVVYSVNKQIDFATNLLSGPHQNSNLAEAFRQTRNHTGEKKQKTVLADFKFYLPSDNKPTAFIAAPVYAENDYRGSLILEFRNDQINALMTNQGRWLQEGLGATGETYLVGPDATMRNDSRFFIETPAQYAEDLRKHGVAQSVIATIFALKTTVLLQDVRTGPSSDALNGLTDTRIARDYRNIPVLSSYTPLNIPGLDWVILSEVDTDEVFSTIQTFKWQAWSTMMLLSLAIICLSLSFSKRLNKNMRILQSGIEKIKRSDFTAKIVLQTGDEFEDLAAHFNQMSTHLTETTASKEALLKEVAQRKQAEEEKKATISDLTKALEKITILEGIVPICSYCKKLRDDEGYWENIEKYIGLAEGSDFTHGICPDCADLHFSDLALYEEQE